VLGINIDDSSLEGIRYKLCKGSNRVLWEIERAAKLERFLEDVCNTLHNRVTSFVLSCAGVCQLNNERKGRVQ
jgi:hypothetical protein